MRMTIQEQAIEMLRLTFLSGVGGALAIVRDQPAALGALIRASNEELETAMVEALNNQGARWKQ